MKTYRASSGYRDFPPGPQKSGPLEKVGGLSPLLNQFLGCGLIPKVAPIFGAPWRGKPEGTSFVNSTTPSKSGVV
jgi:hypothetical protein